MIQSPWMETIAGQTRPRTGTTTGTQPLANPLVPPANNVSIPTMQPTAPMVPPSNTMTIPTRQPTAQLPPAPTSQTPPAAPNTSYEGGTFGSVNGINPVAVTPTSLTGMQPFIEAAYNQSASRLNPQF